jgi:hypothetical protein
MGGCYVGTKPYVSNGARARLLLALCFCVFGGGKSFTNGCSYWTDDYGCHWNFQMG